MSRIEPSETALLEEYKLCQSMVQNQNVINATYESIFLTGSLAATGFVLQNPTPHKMLAVLAISTLILVGGLFLLRRSKKILEVCYCRMNEIENAINVGDLGIQHKLSKVSNRGSSQNRIFTITIVLYLICLLAFTLYEFGLL
ncbi:MAG: hypothetical protein ACLP5V_16465 [Candidatus Bathyarchaeia archaeon]